MKNYESSKLFEFFENFGEMRIFGNNITLPFEKKQLKKFENIFLSIVIQRGITMMTLIDILSIVIQGRITMMNLIGVLSLVIRRGIIVRHVIGNL